jgi:hypothetical protein
MDQLTLEQRVELLESIVKKDSITLTDQTNPGHQIILNFSDGSFKMTKRTTTVVETNFNLSEIETNE